jgi:hypothetical protein
MRPLATTDKTLLRIHRLIALAASPSENEARTAAFLAAKLIRENDVELVYHPTHTERSSSPSEAPRPISAKFDGICRTCGGEIRVGDRILWVAGCGASHSRCGWTP